MALFVFKILNLSEFTRKILEQDRYLQTKNRCASNKRSFILNTYPRLDDKQQGHDLVIFTALPLFIYFLSVFRNDANLRIHNEDVRKSSVFRHYAR